MPYLIGQCCTDQIDSGGTNDQNQNSDVSGKNEIVFFNAPLVGDNIIILPWTAARKARFGDAPVLQVEAVGYSINPGEALAIYDGANVVPDSIQNTTSYKFTLNGPVAGRIIIS